MQLFARSIVVPVTARYPYSVLDRYLSCVQEIHWFWERIRAWDALAAIIQE